MSLQSATFPLECVQLNVDGTGFVVPVMHLVKRSDYFSAYFSDPQRLATATSQGIAISADLETFKHVVSYLRHGVFPLLYDQVTGQHDLIRYEKIFVQAQELRMRKLVKWLEHKLYFLCVDARKTWSVVEISPRNPFRTRTRNGVEYVAQVTESRPGGSGEVKWFVEVTKNININRRWLFDFGHSFEAWWRNLTRGDENLPEYFQFR
ncbi:hypothetical protein QBC46DRAFT_378989 [Diplogelasinospora grovesii]|uniref:BTB domain-containing protein n=1 Tax=Diplogelasinospora grovesii TaxID=303347 RepID=A0AAN6S7G4_9PEZI|nr:hypothetical protein QBC46DRAFT_378989 [Diplogelasinospora grovesii]